MYYTTVSNIHNRSTRLNTSTWRLNINRFEITRIPRVDKYVYIYIYKCGNTNDFIFHTDVDE